MNKALQWVIAQIMDNISKDFYGGITIHFQAGKVHFIDINKTLKPPVDINK